MSWQEETMSVFNYQRLVLGQFGNMATFSSCCRVDDHINKVGLRDWIPVVKAWRSSSVVGRYSQRHETHPLICHTLHGAQICWWWCTSATEINTVSSVEPPLLKITIVTGRLYRQIVSIPSHWNQKHYHLQWRQPENQSHASTDGIAHTDAHDTPGTTSRRRRGLYISIIFRALSRVLPLH